MIYSPGLLIFAMHDLQRKFLVQIGKSRVQMNVQIFGTLFHVLMSYIFVFKLDLGVIGTGYAGICTNSFLLAANIYCTH